MTKKNKIHWYSIVQSLFCGWIIVLQILTISLFLYFEDWQPKEHMSNPATLVWDYRLIWAKNHEFRFYPMWLLLVTSLPCLLLSLCHKKHLWRIIQIITWMIWLAIMWFVFKDQFNSMLWVIGHKYGIVE